MQPTEKRTKQILVVEDEGLIADDIQRRLGKLGYVVPAIARSGEEALRCARSTPFDLVLMDIRLQGDMDGIATAQTLKTELEMPVVYLTAHSDQGTLDRAKLTEPLSYIVKPIGDADLRSAVEISLYRHEMERRLRTSEAWLSTTLGSVGDGIVATDTAGEIVFLNPVATEWTGWSAGEARGRQLMDVLGLFEETTNHPAKNPVFDLLAGETRTYTLLAKKGEKTLVEVACFENRSEKELLGAIVLLRDISARRDLENRLVQSQRMEAVAHMAGVVAHDFNNQLMVIQGYADELCERLSDSDRERAQAIQRSASAATALTRQLLTLSRHDRAQPETLNINELICEVQPLLSRGLGETRTLATDLGSRVGYLRADRTQLKQALFNLALHARHSMPAGGELRIETKVIEVEPEGTPAHIRRPGPYVLLAISYSAGGANKAELSRIFEPSEAVSRAGGARMGLSIVHSIIVQNGGFITAATQTGKGTCFEILLPCVGTFQGLGDVTGARPQGAEGDPVPTILLVEDEDGVRQLMHNYLEQEGFQLLEARDGEEAELIAEVYPEPIHALITDVIMPGRSGPQLATRLSPLRPEMKVLYVSGYRHDTLEQAGLERDMNVLRKPFPASELVRRIRLLLSQEAPSTR